MLMWIGFTPSSGRPALLKNDSVYSLIKERVESGGSATLTVTGVSMEPLLKNGVTVVELSAATEIKKYDIVLYKRESGAVVLHRVVKLNGDTVNCRGDNELVTEKGVEKHRIAAIAVTAETEGKRRALHGLRHRMYGRWRILRRTVLRIIRGKRGQR